MSLFRYGKDGGPASTVWGLWLLEAKRLCSVVLLCFENGSRNAYHSHAFDSVSWVLRGRLVEHHLGGTTEMHMPSWRPVITRRETFHKVVSGGRTWVLSFRGPWARYWQEYLPAELRFVRLAVGRQEVA